MIEVKEYLAIARHCRKQRKREINKSGYEYTSTTHIETVVSTINLLLNKLKKYDLSFIDVGAGYGSILKVLESKSFKNIHGIEINTRNCQIFEEELKQYFYNKNKVKLFNINAFNFDRYKDYDIVYTFNPLCHIAATHRIKFYKHIYSKVKPGTYLYECFNLNSYKELEKEGKLKRILNKGNPFDTIKGVVYQKL